MVSYSYVLRAWVSYHPHKPGVMALCYIPLAGHLCKAGSEQSWTIQLQQLLLPVSSDCDSCGDSANTRQLYNGYMTTGSGNPNVMTLSHLEHCM